MRLRGWLRGELRMFDLAAINRIAAAYPAVARHVPAWEREAYLTEAQQLAWLVRFDPERAAEAMSAVDCRSSAQNRADRVRLRAVPHPEDHHG